MEELSACWQRAYCVMAELSVRQRTLLDSKLQVTFIKVLGQIGSAHGGRDSVLKPGEKTTSMARFATTTDHDWGSR